jgi:hypothetical protein
MDSWAAALEATALARALRGSVWAYPLVNSGHLLGVALLVGAIVPLDLRLLGVWPGIPLPPLWRMLSRMAAIGLFLAGVCGMLLFATRATAYVDSHLFMAKMALVAIGVANAVGLHTIGAGERGAAWRQSGRPPTHVRAAAGLSAAIWLAVLVLGRLVGYF